MGDAVHVFSEIRMRKTSVGCKRVDDETQPTSFMDRTNPVGCRGGIAWKRSSDRIGDAAA